MNRKALTVLASLVLAATSAFAQEKPTIDLAICLDTSGSMEGLIESAKQKIWAVVGDLGTAKPSPRLRVALYQYGNDGLNADGGWVEQLCPLTDDLDTVYGKLFPLRTNGGTEYVARVVSKATQQLEWDNSPQTLRMIIVAGNEPATQDTQIKLEDACKQAAGKGIVINTIFCGNETEGRNTGWADAARFADGRFAAIDQNGGTVVIETPFDKEIADLGTRLNTTYIAYGAAGGEGAANQAAQDRNALSLSAPAAAARSYAKANAQYTNARWDLVDAVKEQKLEVAKVKEEDLPLEMRAMSKEDREKYVQAKAREREDLQKQITTLNNQRTQFAAQEMQKRGLNEKSAFDAALRQAMREQASRKNIQLAN